MNVFEFGPYVAVVPFLSSIVFFFLDKEKSLLQRVSSSIHGWAALAILPASTQIAIQLPELRVGVGLPVILMLGGVSAISVFYSMATVKARWMYHLLHIPTLFTIALSIVASLFVLGDHH